MAPVEPPLVEVDTLWDAVECAPEHPILEPTNDWVDGDG